MSTLSDLNLQTRSVADSLAAISTQIAQLQILIDALIAQIPVVVVPPPPPPPVVSAVDYWSSIDNLYTRLVTSEHQTAPKFMSAVAIAVQGLVDENLLLQAMPTLYDLDVCIGQQEDYVGEWVGITRMLRTPITGVYFAWDTGGVGWDQGSWWEPFEPISEMDSLPDDSYRLLLRFKIAANIWDGTIPQAYQIFAQLFRLTGISILIQDNGDMTMIFALFGPIPNAVTQALFSQGELILRPAGVGATLMSPSMANTPYFGFDVENGSISGWNFGAWGNVNTPP